MTTCWTARRMLFRYCDSLMDGFGPFYRRVTSLGFHLCNVSLYFDLCTLINID